MQGIFYVVFEKFFWVRMHVAQIPSLIMLHEVHTIHGGRYNMPHSVAFSWAKIERKHCGGRLHRKQNQDTAAFVVW